MNRNFLEKAAAAAQVNVAAWKGQFGDSPLRMVRPRPAFLPEGNGRCSIISEVKMASPSRGDLVGSSDPLTLPFMYESAGAGAVSVVVEEQYFKGSPELFVRVGERTGLPLLWKDFVVDPYQVRLAAALGASAVLLIVGMLSDNQLKDFLALASDEGLRALVEVHDEAERERAVSCGATLVGVNNRNLVTLEVDIGVSMAMAPGFPPGVQKVAESGIRTPEDVKIMADAGYDGVLIGEALVTADHPDQLLKEMVEAGKGGKWKMTNACTNV